MKQSVAKALTSLSRVLIDDIEGSVSGVLANPADQRVLTYRMTRPKSASVQAVLLREYPDYVVVAPKFGERPPLKGIVVVLDKRLLVP